MCKGLVAPIPIRPTARLPGPAISPHGGAFLLLLPMLPVFIVVVVPCFVVQVREAACSCAAPSLAVLRSVAADARRLRFTHDLSTII